MPRPLGTADAVRIRAIFALQDPRQVEAAARATRMLHDTGKPPKSNPGKLN